MDGVARGAEPGGQHDHGGGGQQPGEDDEHEDRSTTTAARRRGPTDVVPVRLTPGEVPRVVAIDVVAVLVEAEERWIDHGGTVRVDRWRGRDGDR